MHGPFARVAPGVMTRKFYGLRMHPDFFRIDTGRRILFRALLIVVCIRLPGTLCGGGSFGFGCSGPGWIFL